MTIEELIGTLERSYLTHLVVAEDGERSLKVRSKDDHIAACYGAMREVATVLREHSASGYVKIPYRGWCATHECLTGGGSMCLYGYTYDDSPCSIGPIYRKETP